MYNKLLDGWASRSPNPVGYDQAMAKNKEIMKVLIKTLKTKQAAASKTNTMFLRTFMFKFFDAYVRQYRIEDASTLEEKVNIVFPDFKNSYNIDIESSIAKRPATATGRPASAGKQTSGKSNDLFGLLDITLETLREYVLASGKDKIVPVIETQPYLEKTTFGGGEDDTGAEYSASGSEEE